MTVKLYAFTCGTVTGEFAHLMEGGEGDITVPIPVFLIEHPKGRALFDTGLHPDCQHDPAGRLGSRLAGLFRIGFQPGEEVSARLEAIDRDPGKIDLIINSHFHFDHVGGNALIPNATMLVQRREWEAGMDPDTAARRGFNRAISTSAINCGWSMASTTCLAMARWCVCRRMGTRRGTNPFGCGSITVRSCSPRTPATSVRPSASVACRATCTTARRCWPRLTGWRRWNRAGRASFSATTRSSGARYRRHRSRSDKADRAILFPSTTQSSLRSGRNPPNRRICESIVDQN